MTNLTSLRDQWLAHWPGALTVWSKFTRLREPRWCFTPKEAATEGLTSSFAMIRLNDHAIVIGLHQIAEQGLNDYALEILAHEIGHHVYCPADLTDSARMIARLRRGLPTKEALAPFVGNLYTDLLINNRLQRSAGLRISQIYQKLTTEAPDTLWTFYMRIYEVLWSLPRGQLATGAMDERLELDAQLGARLIRSYAQDWIEGAGRFAALCFPYLQDNGQTTQKILRGWLDTPSLGAGADDMPHGLTEIEDGELEGNLHPMFDPELSGLDSDEAGEAEKDVKGPASGATSTGSGRGQRREPFEYGAILKSLGLDLDNHEIAVRYYKERATPHLIRFPQRRLPESTEPLPEGLEPWDIGSPLEEADWTQSVLASPRIIPGFTTVQRVWGTVEGQQPKKEPLDLDLYVDSSGSIPNPQLNTSYLTLAGAIIALSALRVGAKVQVTLWSGARQFQKTEGFVRDEHQILKILTGYIGGGTAFPIHILRDTFQKRRPTDHPAHILIISDDGVTTMFENDEKGNSGWDVSRMALEKARGGGTMVLNLWRKWEDIPDLKRAHDEQGWEISVVRTWDELIEFARKFSRLKYADE